MNSIEDIKAVFELFSNFSSHPYWVREFNFYGALGGLTKNPDRRIHGIKTDGDLIWFVSKSETNVYSLHLRHIAKSKVSHKKYSFGNDCDHGWILKKVTKKVWEKLDQ